MRIHLAIVSDQILANLIPILMERPGKVYLACSNQMAEKRLDRRFTKLLKDQGMAVEVCGGAPEVGLRDIHDYALALASDIERAHPGAELVLNATGGTKLMALGFVEVFRGIAHRIIYTDTQHRRIELLPDAHGAVSDPVPMENALDVPLYLAAQGFRYSRASSDDSSWIERAAARKAVCKYLGKNAARIQDFIGALNGLADQALAGAEQLVAPRQSFRDAPWGRWAEAMDELVKAGMLRWEQGKPELDFVNAETARFLHGGWLEEYAWHIVRDEGVFDVRVGTEGVWEDTRRSRNEFDVLACHGNQLLFIECKTLKHGADQDNDSDLIYKLDSLSQDARGLFGATWLVSAREPSEVLHERARQARIKLMGPNGLPKLREAVQAWMRGEL